MRYNINQNDIDLSEEDIINIESIAIDTETMGLEVTRDRLCLMQLYLKYKNRENKQIYIIQFNKDSYNKAVNLKKILTNKNILKIFHFARFDIAVIEYYLDIIIDNFYCTKIASKIARTYTDRHGLKILCEEFLDISISKKEQSSDWGKDKITNKQIKYAANDVLYLHEIKSYLDNILIREGKIDLFNKSLISLRYIIDLDKNGYSKIDIFSH